MSQERARELSRTPSNSSQSTDITEPSLTGGVEAKSSASASAFERWRPAYHFQGPSGWMNDPCAPHYDPSTGLYHVSYQSNLDLKNADWGDIVWRSATSSDLVTWDIDHEPLLSPGTSYDGKGVFTGCKVPSRDGSLVYVYTSVSALPIHHTLPHPKGSESLSMAKSFDGGRTWQKYEGNPILPSEPAHLDVTGWRDPFVSTWPSMAATLCMDPENTLFGIISGGIRKLTPTTFLYSIAADDLANWKYLGPLVDFGVNLRPSKWSGDLGKNWEVTNFLTLRDPNDSTVSRDFLVMGTEGCLPSALHAKTSSSASGGPFRPHRGQLWMSGNLVTTKQSHSSVSGPVKMRYNFGGHLDHGCLYAANSFFDSKTSRHVVWGWITEEDLCDELRHEQGWSGLLSLPREIRLETIKNVVHARSSALVDITSIELEANVDDTHTIRTLVSEPVQSVVQRLRLGAALRKAKSQGPLHRRASHNLSFTADNIRTSAWELDCSFRVSERCSEIGLQIIHSRCSNQNTTLFFAPPTETFTIERPSFQSPTSGLLINTSPEYAPHTLFTTVNPAKGMIREEEPLQIRVWRDNSVMEVFVNGRTAISTRLYAAEETVGICFFAEDAPTFGASFSVSSSADSSSCNESQLLYATLWDGIGVCNK